MILEYKNFKAELTYCGKTKGYYGEIALYEEVITFQATNRNMAVQVMHSVVDQYLLQQEERLA